MAECPPDLPWWRVVNKQGGLATYKRDPHLGADQRQRLIDEGVPFIEDRVDMGKCEWVP
jgi:alkylated DNA nucleotide flippase Atl1